MKNSWYWFYGHVIFLDMPTISFSFRLSQRWEEEGRWFVEFAYFWVIGRPGSAAILVAACTSCNCEKRVLVWNMAHCSLVAQWSLTRASPEMRFPQWTQMSPANAIEGRCQSKHRIPCLSQWSPARARQGGKKRIGICRKILILWLLQRSSARRVKEA